VAITEPSADSFEAAFPPACFGLIQEHAPAAYACLRQTYEQALCAADPHLLGLARQRIRLMIDPAAAPLVHSDTDRNGAKLANVADWSTAEVYTPVERACLAFAEQFAFSVADLDDALIAALLAELPAGDVYGLVNGIYVIDALERLSATLNRLFNQEGVL